MDEKKRKKLLIGLGCGICACLVCIILILANMVASSNNTTKSESSSVTNPSTNTNNIVEIEIPTTVTEPTTTYEELTSGSTPSDISTNNSNLYESYGYISYFDKEMSNYYSDDIYENNVHFQTDMLSDEERPVAKATPEQAAAILMNIRKSYMTHDFEMAEYLTQCYVRYYLVSNNTVLDKELLYQLNTTSGYYMYHDTIYPSYEEEKAVLEKVHDPIAFLSLVLESDWYYMYMQDNRSLDIHGNCEILDQGVSISDKNDTHWITAERSTGNLVKSLYRFTVKYNEKYTVYAYVFYDVYDNAYLLSYEHLDGSFTEIRVLEGETDWLDEIFNDDWYPGKYGAGEEQWNDFWEQEAEREREQSTTDANNNP